MYIQDHSVPWGCFDAIPGRSHEFRRGTQKLRGEPRKKKCLSQQNGANPHSHHCSIHSIRFDSFIPEGSQNVSTLHHAFLRYCTCKDIYITDTQPLEIHLAKSHTLLCELPWLHCLSVRRHPALLPFYIHTDNSFEMLSPVSPMS